MPNYNPSPSTRWRKGNKASKGPPRRAWIRRILDDPEEGLDSDGVPIKEKILRHQIKIAMTPIGRCIGVDEKGNEIIVHSGRDSTEAAKFLFGLVGLRPLRQGEDALQIPAGVSVDGRNLLDIAKDVYRARLKSGKITEGEFGEMVRLLIASASLPGSQQDGGNSGTIAVPVVMVGGREITEDELATLAERSQKLLTEDMKKDG